MIKRNLDTRIFYGIIFFVITFSFITNAREFEFQNGHEYLPTHAYISSYCESADFNDDGLTDIIFADHTMPTRVRIWIQGEDGNYIDETEERTPEFYYSIGPLVLIDVESDGDMDIFVGNYDDFLGVGRLLINDGDGYFTDETEDRLPTNPIRCYDAKAGTIDGNSSSDIVIIQMPTEPKLLLNDGNGVFSWDTEGRMPVYDYYTSRSQIVDIDEDGANDILFATQNATGIICYYNTGDGFFEDQSDERIPSFNIDFMEDLVFDDIDIDGDMDFVALKADGIGASLPLYLNDGDGYFSVSSFLFDIPDNHWPFRGEFALLDDDEYPDLFMTNTYPEDNQDLLFVNNGDGTFTYSSEELLPNRGDRSTYCTIFDHSNDDDLDIFVNISNWDFISAPRVNLLYENLLTPNSAIGDELFTAVPEKEPQITNYPNPFNPNTTIAFNLPESQKVSLAIYDVQGKLIKTLINKTKQAGYHSVIWNGKDENGKEVSSGFYFYRIESENFSQSKKCLLLK
jgi:hypothetical protein